MATSARNSLQQQWAVPHQEAQINSVGLSQHSAVLALTVSTSALVIAGVGSWRIAWRIDCGAGAFAWVLVERKRKAPVHDIQSQLNEQEGRRF